MVCKDYVVNNYLNIDNSFLKLKFELILPPI